MLGLTQDELLENLDLQRLLTEHYDKQINSMIFFEDKNASQGQNEKKPATIHKISNL